MISPIIEVSVSAIAAFAADRRVCRAFGHLIAAAPDALLLVPIGWTTGDLRAVVDGCPVPWEEVWAVIDAPPGSVAPVQPDNLCRDMPALARITPYGWISDVIPPFAAGRPAALRLTHATGIRYAKV